jgi:carbon monoxide dehydrogenase subunit G
MSALTDPQTLKFCIPKCRTVRRLSPTSMRVSADIGVLNKSYQLDGLLEITALENNAGYDVQCNVAVGAVKLGRIEGRILVDDALDNASVSSSTTIVTARKFNPLVEKLAEPLAKSLSNAFFKRLGVAAADVE